MYYHIHQLDVISLRVLHAMADKAKSLGMTSGTVGFLVIHPHYDILQPVMIVIGNGLTSHGSNTIGIAMGKAAESYHTHHPSKATTTPVKGETGYMGSIISAPLHKRPFPTDSQIIFFCSGLTQEEDLMVAYAGADALDIKNLVQ